MHCVSVFAFNFSPRYELICHFFGNVKTFVMDYHMDLQAYALARSDLVDRIVRLVCLFVVLHFCCYFLGGGERRVDEENEERIYHNSLG